MSSIFFYLVTKRQEYAIATRNRAISIPSDSTANRSDAAVGIITCVEMAQKNKIAANMLPVSSTNQEEGSCVVQVDVAFLSYVETEVNAHMQLDSITYATTADLVAHEDAKRKQKHQMGKNAYKHFKWVGSSPHYFLFHPVNNYHISLQYIKTLRDELDSLEPNQRFKIVHWLISSRNVNAFIIKDEFFPAISIIIAPQKEHWYAAYDGRSKYGTKNRTSSEDQGPVPIPTYLKCRADYCANNCTLCQKAQICICNQLRQRSSSSFPTIEENELEDLV